jgi:hypothetical protein
MTRRASFTQADYTRAIKGALKAGLPVGSFKVTVEAGVLTILPVAQSDAPVVISDGYSKALDRWRRSA